ncbi:alpha/beta fold hydrolase [Modestobacter italicus]|uniref:alpha/beta fold hydrolase n=1 Tax=Modestobacter italicus (strain DSM 44449 / CECT 9708 / BC 501) TaxID=2732864 RepID=UPI001C9705DC|nr:alpha/beta hydrolase [Modestobacter italicus]
MKESSLEANGVPELVCVPGLGLDDRSWTRVRRRSGGVVVRLPGMGERAPVGSLSELTDQLVAALGPGPVVLAGHSQSCQVVVAAAERDPRVVGLLLLGPTTDPRLRRTRVLAGRWLRTALCEQWWHAPLIVRQWLRTGPPAMTRLWQRTSPDRVDERLRRVQVPVLVVRGARDALCAHDWAVHLAACAPRGRLVELPGAAHMLPITRPDAVAALARELTGRRAT